jgi:hypothetical protein
MGIFIFSFLFMQCGAGRGCSSPRCFLTSRPTNHTALHGLQDLGTKTGYKVRVKCFLGAYGFCTPLVGLPTSLLLQVIPTLSKFTAYSASLSRLSRHWGSICFAEAPCDYPHRTSIYAVINRFIYIYITL